MSALRQLMVQDLSASVPEGLPALLESIERRFGQAVLGIVLYGSCRRQQQLDEGLVDLLVIVSSYRAAYGFGLAAVFNRLLPPNVYYLEAESPLGRLRSKYAVITLSQFRRRCRHPVDLYFWARFTQPCRLVLSRDQALAEQLADARASAAHGFAGRITPLFAQRCSPVDFWSFALATTYRCELRPEPPGMARSLVESDANYWQRLSEALACANLAPKADPRDKPPAQQISGRLARRWFTHAAWAARRVSGKLYNLARLFKSAGTFSNGIDYIVWKVERHSGVRVEPTERMRRYPRLAAWGLAWQMWRQGGFR